jgi:hypothetical protein
MATNKYTDGNLVVDAVLDKFWGLNLGDRGYVGNHPALAYLGNLGLSGSDTISRDFADLGIGVMQGVAEDISAGAATALGFDRVSVSVGRKTYKRRLSDMIGHIDPTGLVRDPAAFAFDATTIRGNTLMSLIATIGSTFTAGVSAGAATKLTWAKFREAKQTLIAADAEVVPGKVLALLDPYQWANLEEDMTTGSLGDAVTHTAEGYNIQLAQSMGYQGNYYGIDVYTTKRVPLDGSAANHVGCMVAPGGIAWAEALLAPNPHAFEMLLGGGQCQIEFQRDADKFAEDVYYNSILGVSKGLEGAGVTITSDKA